MLDEWFRKTGTPALLPSSHGSDLVPYGNCPAVVRFNKNPVVQEKMQYYLFESAAMGQPLANIKQHKKKVVIPTDWRPLADIKQHKKRVLIPADWRSTSMTEKRELIRDMTQYHQQ